MIKTKVLQKVDDMESPHQESFSNMVHSTFSNPQGQAPFQKDVDALFKIANQTPIQAILSEPPPTIQQEVKATYEQLNNSLKSCSKEYAIKLIC